MESPFCPDDLTPDLRVIETLGWDGSRYPRLDRHLARARMTCAALGIPFDDDACLGALPQPKGTPARIRLTIAPDGQIEVTQGSLAPAAAQWRITVASERLDPEDIWLRVKTTRRAVHDRARVALPVGIDEAIFINTRNEVCEGTITNLFFNLGEGLSTPPLTSGLLPGVLRAELIEQGCRESILRADDLPRARLWVGNGLRGLIPAVLVQ